MMHCLRHIQSGNCLPSEDDAIILLLEHGSEGKMFITILTIIQ
jgi:hypothetical protein